MIPVIETATARYRSVLLANVHAAQQPAVGDPATFAAPSLGQVEGLVANYRAALFAKHGAPLRKADDAVDEWLEPDLAMADAYIGEVRAEIIDPFIEAAETALEVGGTAALINMIIGRPAQGLGPGVWWIVEDSARDHFGALAAWQRIETLRFFQAAIGYSVEPILFESRIAVSLEARILENVSRISSIPADMHNDLARRLFGVMQTHGADYDLFKEALAKQHDVTGYRLERLAQDQTAKAFAVQNELYQRMAGIAEYRWSTSRDDRVRPTHQAHEGQVYRWNSAPPDTGHPGNEILCRCVAIPIIPPGGIRVPEDFTPYSFDRPRTAGSVTIWPVER